jgi:hypothetical protein
MEQQIKEMIKVSELKVVKIGGDVKTIQLNEGDTIMDVLTRAGIGLEKSEEVRLNNKKVDTTSVITETGTLVISQLVQGGNR